MQYIPLLLTLKCLLQHEDILTQVLRNGQSRDSLLRDYCDGLFYKGNALFRDHPNALQIIYYMDDFTLTNPFRDRGRKYKFCGNYYTLGNLEPKHRSKLDMIQLAILRRTTFIKKYGLGTILQPLLRDVTTLEREGIHVECDGTEDDGYGTITFVCADNLGAHSIARMYENFSTTLRNAGSAV